VGYVPTSSWKVLAPKKVVRHPMTSVGIPVNLVVLHHTVTPDGPFFDILRSVDRFHQSGVYNDIAYNAAASNSSDAFTDLRGPMVQGGATGKWNGEVIDRRSLSIVVPGDFQTAGKDNPDPRVIENVARLIVKWINDGHVAEDFTLEPHRNYHRTSCCGDRLLALIPAMRNRVNQILADVEDTSSSVVTEEEAMRVPLVDWNKEFIRYDRSGEYNAAVEVWQRALVAAGFDPGPIDGIRGAQTEAANIRFEIESQLRSPANGYPERNVWVALLKILANPPKVITQTVEVEVEAPQDPALAEVVRKLRANVANLQQIVG